MTRTLCACAAVLLLAASPAAAADDVTEARAHFDAGAKLYRAGKFRQAIGEFETAYRLKPHGAIHFNVARCRERLEEWPAALRSYTDYLREVPEATDRAAVRAAIVRIERRLAKAGVQALLVYSDPPGATVRLDGKVRGRTPFHITLPPGIYRVAVALDGFQPEEQEAEVSAPASRLLDLVLRPRAAPAAAQPAAHPAAPPAAAGAVEPPAPGVAAPGPAAKAAAATATDPGSSMASQVPTSPPRPAPGPVPPPAGAAAPDLAARPPAASPVTPAPAPPAAPPAARGRRYTWVALGAAAVAGAAGAWFGAAAARQQDALRDGTVHPDADALARDARSKAKTANLLYGLSGAAAAAGVTLFVVEGRF